MNAGGDFPSKALQAAATRELSPHVLFALSWAGARPPGGHREFAEARTALAE